ncbi:MAG TPA: group II intron reverse transcriptase/maturase [Candidatus Dormibacteraeota bacterium]|nr:group II intron reverse transcriptase/maturase [Candidatus Dormibacteraeota bacterium]
MKSAMRPAGSEEARPAALDTGCLGASDLMERVLTRPNLQAALKRVRQNKGSPGIDGMTVEELPDYLREHWSALRERLLAGHYQPQAVRRQLIPKSGGGVRELGIPTVLDRFIQQAFLQVLQPLIDPSFSQHSYGFRPGRRAHEAILAAQAYIQEGRRWVVDVDLERFFDRVNHDVLMGKLAGRIADRRILGLIRRYLEAGIMAHGVVIERYEGTPQGGPLSPLLANVLLDAVDKELEHSGHAFVRYADDCNVYVRSRRAGERVMRRLEGLYGRLWLRINKSKSAVAFVQGRKFLGYTFWFASGGVVKRAVAHKALGVMKERVRRITRRNAGRSIEQVAEELRRYLVGWREYFRLAQTPRTLGDLDQWLRHRLRALHLKHWRRGRVIYRELRARGLTADQAAIVAGNARRWWHNSALLLNRAFPVRYFDQLGLPRLAA